jgi:hypothetical protein
MKRTTTKPEPVATPTIESLQARVDALEATQAEREEWLAEFTQYMDTFAGALFRCTALEAFEQHKVNVAARKRDQETPNVRGYSAKWGQPIADLSTDRSKL